MAYDKDSFLAGIAAGRTLNGAGAGGSAESSSGSGVIVEYVGNSGIGGVDFRKYKANDVILVVQDMTVQEMAVSS